MSFYLPIRNVKADIYVGINAGKHLIEDIKSAKNSIKIVSPYISPKYVSMLKDKAHDGVNVTLITPERKATSFKDRIGHYETIHMMLRQNEAPDECAIKNKIKLRRKSQIVAVLGIVLFILTILAPLLHFVNKAELIMSAIYALLFCSIGCLVIFLLMKDKLKRQAVRSFFYTSLIKLRICKDNIDMPFIHAKLYVVDNRIAYLGSTNFTVSGLENSIESSMKILDSDSILRLSEWIDSIAEMELYYSYDELGRMYFQEDYFSISLR